MAKEGRASFWSLVSATLKLYCQLCISFPVQTFLFLSCPYVETPNKRKKLGDSWG